MSFCDIWVCRSSSSRNFCLNGNRIILSWTFRGQHIMLHVHSLLIFALFIIFDKSRRLFFTSFFALSHFKCYCCSAVPTAGEARAAPDLTIQLGSFLSLSLLLKRNRETQNQTNLCAQQRSIRSSEQNRGVNGSENCGMGWIRVQID